MDAWASWVLHNHPDRDCPWLATTNDQRACIWPGQLTLNTSDSGAKFSMGVDVFSDQAWVAIPGSSRHWPMSVTINGEPAAVVERGGKAMLAVGTGSHRIAGQFRWNQLPAQLALPRQVAIVLLTVNGAARAVDRRSDQLILSNKAVKSRQRQDNSLAIEVYRRLDDGVPMTITSKLKLRISGASREVSFGPAAMPGTALLSLQSRLPARLEPNGTMRVQVRPGEYEITLVSRFLSQPQSIVGAIAQGAWPGREIISFRADPSLREVQLSGVPSVDTSQLSMPRQWLHYPTYSLAPGERLSIATEYRGDHSPAANELSLHRDLWLDFDGDALTSLDRIRGAMHRDWRLNAAPGSQIGRASVDGEAVLITSDKGGQGIEIRSPSIDLEAVSRVAQTSDIDAVGWDANVDEYRSVLHLPPGWRVLHGSGVDRISGTWLAKWDLWDVFLLLVMVAATRKLMNNKVAVLAACSFVIALQEIDSPLLLVPGLLIVLALLPRVSGIVRRLLGNMGLLMGVALVLSLITFAVSTFRLAIYPSLELSQRGSYQQRETGLQGSAGDIDHLSSMAASAADGRMEKNRRTVSKALLSEPRAASMPRLKRYQLADSDRVQTGPGLPKWTWNAVHFSNSGPLSAGQRLSVYYSPPWLTSVWRILAVLLVSLYSGLLLVRLSRLYPVDTVRLRANAPLAVAAVLSLTFISESPNTVAQSYPPQYLLQELETRLTRAPECLPNCASLNNGTIVIADRVMNLAFEVYVDADIALPLPNGHGSWHLQAVNVDKKPAVLMQREGLYIHLNKGHHLVRLTANINADRATIQLPLPVHNIELSAPQWQVEGLVDGRVRAGTLSLQAVDASDEIDTDTLKPAPIPVFAAVSRRLSFGKQWQITTTVTRRAPQEGAISLAIPLLDGEKLLRDIGKLEQGVLTVQLSHQQNSISWVSSIQPVEQLELVASSSSDYSEDWLIVPSSLWRVVYSGIPPVKRKTESNRFEPSFKPWPGETLQLTIRRPEGVAGATHTVENATLNIRAGAQLQRSELQLGIRSSLGENYAIELPADAEVLSLSVDGRVLNNPGDFRLKIPLHPGLQRVQLSFQQRAKLPWLAQTPVIVLPSGAANIEINYELPRDRWPLALSGPAIGPAMLYWGVLAVIVIAALLLPRIADATGMTMPIAAGGWLLLGLGLSTVNSYGVLVIAAMFFLLAARRQMIDPYRLSRFRFNALQCFIALWVLLAVGSMLSAIPLGLLSSPQMNVLGNGSSSHSYRYYQDLVGPGEFPSATVLSLPIIFYRASMLLWSLWLASKMLQWASWSWTAFVSGVSWRTHSSEQKDS